VDYPFSLAQLAQILSALENERGNPNTKRNAMKAIERSAAQIGLSAEDVFDAADGLLSGRLSAAQFRAQLRDEGCGPARFVIEPRAEPAPDGAANEPAETSAMSDAGPLAEAESGTDDDSASDVSALTEHASLSATAALAANPATTEARVGAKQQLAACHAAEHWLQAERNNPGETRPDEILRVLRAAIERAEGQPRQPHQTHEAHRQRPAARGQQGIAGDRDAAPAGGGDAGANQREHRLASPYYSRVLRRRAEEAARARRDLGEAGRR
jgi:hypothetical protein